MGVLLPDGVYILHNLAVPVALDLSIAPGDGHTSWERLQGVWSFDQQWFIRHLRDGDIGTYTLQCLRSGTFLELDGGASLYELEASASSMQFTKTEKSKIWKIQEREDMKGGYLITCLANNACLEVKAEQGPDSRGITIYGREFKVENLPLQTWTLKKRSRSYEEIKSVLEKTRALGKTLHPKFAYYRADSEYITLPDDVRRHIYQGSNLAAQCWRQNIFDCDDFAFVMKAQVALKSAEIIKANGVAVLFGVMFGIDPEGPGSSHAYNFYLNQDLDEVQFFDPSYGGQEMSSVANGYMAYFGVF